MLVDGSPLIPSLAVQTEDPGQPWIFGRQAAALNPGAGLTVHVNWKSALFSHSVTPDSATSIIIASEFFRWLKVKLEAAGCATSQSRVRITMPEFGNANAQASVLMRCMNLAGWRPRELLAESEPRANFLGLFARGRNYVSYSPRALDPFVNFGRMYGQGNELIQAARNEALFGASHRLFRYVILDIGAYTSDVALVEVDPTGGDEYDDGIRRHDQKSWAHAIINELDQPLFSELLAKYSLVPGGIKFETRELWKRNLYNGQTVKDLMPGRGLVTLGAGGDADIIRTHIRLFEERLWTKIGDYCRAFRPNLLILTGGGSRIALLRELVQKSFSALGTRMKEVDDFQVAPSTGPDLRKWSESGETLTRLATALGGTSVILNAPKSSLPTTPRSPRLLPKPYTSSNSRPGWRTCVCGGMNQDCGTCGGRGEVRG